MRGKFQCISYFSRLDFTEEPSRVRRKENVFPVDCVVAKAPAKTWARGANSLDRARSRVAVLAGFGNSERRSEGHQ